MADFNDVITIHGDEKISKKIEQVIVQKKIRPKGSKRIYGMLPVSIWTDPKYQKFQKCSCSAQRLYMYLISCPQRNMIGFYRQSIEAMAVDLRAQKNAVSDALDELIDQDIVRFDSNVLWVWVVDLFAMDIEISRNGSLKPEDKIYVAAINRFTEIPDIGLKQEFRKYYQELLNLDEC
jgi:hypothetical protein